MAKLQTEIKFCKGLFHLLFILPFKKDNVITYYNNFDKFKHIIYATLLNTDEGNNTATVFPQFLEQCQSTLYDETNQILGSKTNHVVNIEQVGVANAATN